MVILKKTEKVNVIAYGYDYEFEYRKRAKEIWAKGDAIVFQGRKKNILTSKTLEGELFWADIIETKLGKTHMEYGREEISKINGRYILISKER